MTINVNPALSQAIASAASTTSNNQKIFGLPPQQIAGGSPDAVPIEPSMPVKVFGPGTRAVLDDREVHAFTDEQGNITGSFILPAAMRCNSASGSIWNAWYGSAKNANRAADMLTSIRVPGLASLLKVIKRSTPTQVLSVAFSTQAVRDEIYAALTPEQYKIIHPYARLDANLSSILGEAYKNFIGKRENGNATDYAAEIESFWPWFRAIHDNGAFSSGNMGPMLKLGLLREYLDRGNRLTSTERGRAFLAVNFILASMPSRLSAIVSVQTGAFRDAFARPFKFCGITQESFNPDVSIWDQVGIKNTHSMISYMLEVAECNIEKSCTGVLAKTLLLEPRVVSHAGYNRTLAGLYKEFCDYEAGPRFNKIIDAFARYSVALEVKIDSGLLPTDLIGRDLDFSKLPNGCPVILDKVCNLMNLDFGGFDCAQFLQEADERMTKVTRVHSKITELSSLPSISNMLKLAELAGEARDEILSHRDWFFVALNSVGSYVSKWQTFYAEMAALIPSAPANDIAPRSSSAKKAVHKTQPSIPAAPVFEESKLVKHLRDQVVSAETDADHLRAELKASRTETHRLRQMSEVYAATGTKVSGMVCDHTLIRRVVARESLSASEVLSYIEFLAGDRLVVLDTAWDAAADYLAPYPHAERMLYLLDKLVFDYLDAMNAGAPDAQARLIFGTKAYSAKESDTTLSVSRLRAMREFSYQGEKQLFERHLRVSNATGFEGMRVYFEIINNQVVLAYVGRHLEVSGSN